MHVEINRVKHAILHILIVLVFLIFPVRVGAIDAHEQSLVTAFLYNFAKFTEWPAHLLAEDDTFVICIEHHATIKSSLNALSHRRIKGRAVRINTMDNTKSVSGCHLVYFEADSALLKSLQVESVPALLVGKEVKTADIILTRVGDKLQFSVRQGRAERQGLRFRSQLLSIASRTISD